MNAKLRRVLVSVPIVWLAGCKELAMQPTQFAETGQHRARTTSIFTGVPGYIGTSESGLPVVLTEGGTWTNAKVIADIAVRGNIIGSGTFSTPVGITFTGFYKARWQSVTGGSDSVRRFITPEVQTSVSPLGGTNALFTIENVQPFDCRTAYGSMAVEGDFVAQKRIPLRPFADIVLAMVASSASSAIPDSMTYGEGSTKPVASDTVVCTPKPARVVLTKDTLLGLTDMAVASIDDGAQPCLSSGTFSVTSPMSPNPVYLANGNQVISQGLGVATVVYKCDAQGFRSKEWTIYPRRVVVRPLPEQPTNCDDPVTWDVVEQCPGGTGTGSGPSGGFDPYPLGAATSQPLGGSSSSGGLMCTGRDWYWSSPFYSSGDGMYYAGTIYLGWLADSCWPV